MAAGLGLGAPFEFLLAGFPEEHEEKELNNIMTKIRELGGRAHNAPTYVSKCTHVISYKPIRSEKFLCGVASGKWILKPEFITHSSERGKWQAESMYEWSEGDVSENVPPGLLTAPRRWREKIAASGHGAFHDWKVLLHVDVTNNKDRYLVYKRVLEAGGGQCVPVTFPIKEPAGLVSLFTHVIVEKCYEKDIQCLEARGIPCLLPEFIMEHLFQENVNMTQYHVSSALMTPTQAMRQRNEVVPTVRAKKDHGMQTNPSGRERDTPGSTTSLAEDNTSSDPGSSVKRKLDLDSLSEPLPMLKKKKVKRKNPKDASTSKAANVRRSPRIVKGGSRIQSNTKVKDRSRETLPSSKPNSGKDKVSCSTIAHHSPKSLPRKTNVNRKNGKGETPLHEACIKNNITRVRELLNEPDIDVNARDNAEWTPLHEACNRGNTACVKELLRFAPGKTKITNSGTESRSMQTLDLLAAPSECGTTPLHDAVCNNQIEVVKLLVEAGGRSLLTAMNKAGFTPVGMAQTDVMKGALLGQRSEVSKLPAIDEENENTSRKHKCTQCPYSSKRKYDVKRHFSRIHEKGQSHDHESLPERTTPIHTAVQSIITPVPGNAEKEKGQQKALRKQGIAQRIVSRPSHSRTPIDKPMTEKTRIGPNPNGDSKEKKFVHLNIKSNRSSESVGFGSKRANNALTVVNNNNKKEPNAEEDVGSYVKDAKKCNGSLVDSSLNEEMPEVPCSSIARYSLRSSTRKANVNRMNPKVPCSSNTDHSPRSSPKKTKVNRKNGKGETPLHVACIKNNITRVRELLNEHDIDVNARDNAEWTPLHEACNHGHTDCVKELLKFAPGKRKITSTESISMQTLDLLAVPSKCGTTPLHDAVDNNQIEVAKLLVEAGGRSLLTVMNKAGFTPVDIAQTGVMKEAILGQRSEVSRLPAVDEENENRRTLLTFKNKAGFTPVDMAQTEVMKEGILGQRSEVIRLPAVDIENENRRILLTVKDNAGLTPINVARTEVMKKAILGQRSEVSRLSAIDDENNESTLKAANVRRSPRRVKGGSRLNSNTKVKDRSTETLPSSKLNLGKDEGSAMTKLPSEKDDASVTPDPPRKMDKLLHYVAESVPMDKVLSLGTALEIEYVQIEHFSTKNVFGSTTCTYEGTLKMLHVWTSKQKDNNIQALLAALEQVGLNKLSSDVKLEFIK